MRQRRGRYTLSAWPENWSWDFVAVGRGHDVDYWRRFLQALEKVDPDMAVNIEHEDQVLGRSRSARPVWSAARQEHRSSGLLLWSRSWPWW